MTHYLNLAGAKTINTPGYSLVARIVPSLVESMAMAAAYGPAGTGKTFAVTSALGKVPQEIEVHSIELQYKPTTRHVVKTLLDTISGLSHEGSRHQLTEQLVQVLAERPRVVAMDEAQRLNKDCFEMLRYLHDRPNTTFALLFSGGNGCREVLLGEPMLASRIYQWAGFSELTTDQVLQAIPRWHPLYEDANLDDILYVDDHFAHGNFRRWAGFTKSAVAVASERGLDTLTQDLAGAVFATQGGGLRAA